MRLFAERERLSDFLSGRLAALLAEVKAENAKRLVGMNESEFADYLVERHRVEPVRIDWTSAFVSPCERQIPGEEFPRGFNVERGEHYTKVVITYHLPFRGDSAVLKLQPSSRILLSFDLAVTGDELRFDVVNFRDDPEEITRAFDEMKTCVSQNEANSRAEVEGFNGRLRPEALSAIKARKTEIGAQTGFLASLGVPVRRVDSAPATFSVPVTRKPTLIKPSSSTPQHPPEPALAEQTYREILRMNRDLGREIERHPSLYAGKDEETLRDHFLLMLSPHFQSTTAETFNKKGKTDILIRHEGHNVFVAECKVWVGPKVIAETIDQVMSYLTWRDSKAAILFFVPNKQFMPVLEQIRAGVPKHPLFVANRGQPEEGWQDFTLHLPGDPTRNVSLAVISFHFP